MKQTPLLVCQIDQDPRHVTTPPPGGGQGNTRKDAKTIGTTEASVFVYSAHFVVASFFS